MKNKIKLLVPGSILLAVVVLGGYLYMNPLLPIITGYSAKNLASGIFVAGRTQEAVEQEDLNFSFIKFNRNKVDLEKKEVTSSFLWDKSKAIYIEGFGCVLVNEQSEDEIRNRPYSVVPQPNENTDTIAWPAGDRIADTIPAGIDMNKLNAVLDQAFADTPAYKGTFAVAVVYKGQLVAEQYRSDMKPHTKFLSWSMAKSFTNALVGILVQKGQLNIDEPLSIDEWQADDRKKITLSNLMRMNSGLKWNEDYGNSSDVNNMLHKFGDMAQFTAQQPFEFPADSVWVYASGSTNLASKIIRNTIGNDAKYFAFPRHELFNKIGMKSAIFEPDASGTFVGSSYLYATLRDYARFGLLYLNNGNWLGEQILPKNWVEYTTTVANGSNGQYGAFFWLNRSGDYPGVPADMFCARGHDGQYIYIIPSKELVVVRNGYSKKGTFDFQSFLKGIVEAVE
jgi:CubicO group peptidase (beta-lactamase class C family)